MLLTIPQVLDPAQVRHLIAAAWADGKITAGSQSAQQKRNRQLPEDAPMAEEASPAVSRSWPY